MMEYLPNPAERAWLLARIADLVAEGGVGPWVTGHLLEPSARDLPDRWTPDMHGVERIARRLLRYAGLDTVVPMVFDAQGSDAGQDVHACALATALPVRFAGLESQRVLLAVDEDALEDAEVVVAALAHAVAHVHRVQAGLGAEAARGEYRAAPHLPGARAELVEERCVDITAVYLGFGVLTTNGAEKHQSSGEVRGTNASLRVEVTKIGALTPQEQSFALAAQLLSRRLEARDDKRVIGHLAANQAAYVRASLKHLRQTAPELARDLGVPDREHWPSPRALEELLGPLDERPSTARAPKRNRGRRVFRVVRTRATQYAMLFGSAAATIGGVAARADPAAVLGSALLGTVLGAGVGQRRRNDACSDPACEGQLLDGQPTCPRCGGIVSGKIRRAEDRLAALEEIERERARCPADAGAPRGRKRAGRG
jgi:hypothetical protein